MDISQALKRYLEARFDGSVSNETLIRYADELAEALTKNGR